MYVTCPHPTMDPSDNDASRSIMLRRQREAALRRRSNQVTQKSDGNGEDGCNSGPSLRRMSSASTIAVEDVMAWEDAKKRERIEARIREEGIRRAEDAEIRAEALAQEEEEKVRRAEIEKYERRKLDIRRKLEADEREKAARKLEEEIVERRRLAEEIAETQRLEREMMEKEKLERERLEQERLAKERLERERIDNDRLEKERLGRDKMADLERRLAEAEKARIEAERLAERACRIEQQLSMECRSSAPSQKSEITDLVSERATDLDSKNGCRDVNGTRMVYHRVLTSQMNQSGLTNEKIRQATVCDQEIQGRSNQDMIGSNSGYQRYLTTFHQPSGVSCDEISGSPVPSESSKCTPMLQAGPSPMTKSPDTKGSKIKRSVSTRSLTFTDTDAAEEIKQSGSSGKDPTRTEGSKLLLDKNQSLKHITSIDSVNLDDPMMMCSFLMRPCPRGLGMVQCHVRRNKGIKNALFPEYRMHLKGSDGKSQTFLMTSKKRGTISFFTPLLKISSTKLPTLPPLVGNTTSNYLISMGRNDHDKNSDSILGKLRSNFLGTEYHIYDHGKNPEYEEAYFDEKNHGDIRCELGVILYAASTSLGSKGPRKMKVCISKVDEDGIPLKVWQPTKKDDESMATCLKRETSSLDKLYLLGNMPSSWNDEAGTSVLTFNGRVTMASVKNFQLCTNDGQHIMQFGRTGNDEFSLDVQWPMSLFQSFAVALSSFDSKLGCD